ncbi:hypothetical protein COLO4_13359 [Corchorus olitorius]|uniref:F-box domain-containing protein n=1 Tax=Corchorus olitorius TaxID=93759 RepID=A0A1R3JWT8_9ROSI|nr:hypothetical protein COLO4_13359 [Corchorus olitorius]
MLLLIPYILRCNASAKTQINDKTQNQTRKAFGNWWVNEFALLLAIQQTYLLVMWTSFKRWRRGEASANANIVSNKKSTTTANRRGKGAKAHKWCWPWSRANYMPVASRPIQFQPEILDDKSCNCNLALVFWSDEGKAANLFNLLPLFEEILARIVTEDEGPQNLCRLSCVCKFFYDASNEAETLTKVKISFLRDVRFKPICYDNFVSKCAIVGNLRAIAALEVLGTIHIDEDCESHVLNDHLYASYFLEMMFEKYIIRGESPRPCFVAKGQWPYSESSIYIRRNARRIVLKLGIDRPLKRVEYPCVRQRLKARCFLEELEPEFFGRMTYSLSYHCELFRIASVAAFGGESDE